VRTDCSFLFNSFSFSSWESCSCWISFPFNSTACLCANSISSLCFTLCSSNCCWGGMIVNKQGYNVQWLTVRNPFSDSSFSKRDCCSCWISFPLSSSICLTDSATAALWVIFSSSSCWNTYEQRTAREWKDIILPIVVWSRILSPCPG